MRPHRPVADLNDTAINKRTLGRGLERPGDAVVASFCKAILVEFLGGGGGRIEVIICDGAGELDRTVRSLMSTTPQSTNVRGGGGWNGQGMAWRLRFIRGFWSIFLCGGVG